MAARPGDATIVLVCSGMFGVQGLEIKDLLDRESLLHEYCMSMFSSSHVFAILCL